MKVILNKDLTPLGEEGDVKEVAKGYARNYLFPRGLALPFTPRMIKLIEGRRAQIEERKEQKRLDARGLKEKLDTLELTITMPAGANGRLYGAVTNQTITDELAKVGFQIERKRIEIAGNGFKAVGKYKATVKLYENQTAEISILIAAQEIKTEPVISKSAPRRGRRVDHRSEVKESTETSAAAEPVAQTIEPDNSDVSPSVAADLAAE
ncbi:MAG: 50S ribosomal protein L9 [Treponema sp.]|jgi:large subunit ribosomal protein L9|nr:50S ribosomal protein L9 [Treponema sp.]